MNAHARSTWSKTIRQKGGHCDAEPCRSVEVIMAQAMCEGPPPEFQISDGLLVGEQ